MEIRPTTIQDLPAINRVIDAAVMGWKLPERVKRLALPSYRYDAADIQHLSVQVIEMAADGIVAVAAWEPADPRDTPGRQSGLLLHGLYVHPDVQQQGLGKRLLQEVKQAALACGYAGVLVKAQADAESFFAACGLQKLPVEDTARHYAGRYWIATSCM
ncbi:MAG: GNAT family N-acetyltransferase [Thiothrix sp.]